MYKNQFLERKTKAVADTVANQMISSMEVLLALYSNCDEVSILLQRVGFNHNIIKKYHYISYDEKYKSNYVLAPFVKILLNTENNKEALLTIINNECIARTCINSINSNALDYLRRELSGIAYYNYKGEKIENPQRTQKQQNKATYNIKNNNNSLRNNPYKHDIINIKKIKSNLHKDIIGQERAIETVMSTLIRSSAGLTDENKPEAKFLFCGPTGVGKTELAKILAKEFRYNIIKIDMSEYQEKVSLTKLIGAAPGYIGYEEGGQLTAAIESHPKSVIIFDEIEKAHPDIFNLFLQLLDEGKLTDNKGTTIAFNQSIIIFTSNVGANDISDYDNLTRDKYDAAIKNTFKPEFINRLDEIIIFDKLGKESLIKIISKQLDILKSRLQKKNINMIYDTQFLNSFMEKNINSINFNYGAREICRLVEKKIGTAIAEGLCSSEIINGDSIRLINNSGIYKKIV
ncbi:sigma-54 interaction domain protein [Clostridium argentinense CDC 2741]|uniref:Sigma-54 interaction domain protein n=2 Tax=Clostridium argentinense TaxID=29341 RepID=A0A0C1QUW4_9CLOT|nr:AAA family ATPase [Clostridium argentinense]ARC83176.1 hypothetical protein RSJ17_00575 [Clostridium argentinense]KIE44827.1 sigma-54 interaction domain protein [Clostridium argentinense CDC 2741]